MVFFRWKMLYAARYGKFRQIQLDGENSNNNTNPNNSSIIPIIPNLERYLLSNQENQQQSTQPYELSQVEDSLRKLHSELMKRKQANPSPSFSSSSA